MAAASATPCTARSTTRVVRSGAKGSPVQGRRAEAEPSSRPYVRTARCARRQQRHGQRGRARGHAQRGLCRGECQLGGERREQRLRRRAARRWRDRRRTARGWRGGRGRRVQLGSGSGGGRGGGGVRPDHGGRPCIGGMPRTYGDAFYASDARKSMLCSIKRGAEGSVSPSRNTVTSKWGRSLPSWKQVRGRRSWREAGAVRRRRPPRARHRAPPQRPLGMPQRTLSRGMVRLEDDLGVALFARRGRGSGARPGRGTPSSPPPNGRWGRWNSRRSPYGPTPIPSPARSPSAFCTRWAGTGAGRGVPGRSPAHPATASSSRPTGAMLGGHSTCV